MERFKLKTNKIRDVTKLEYTRFLDSCIENQIPYHLEFCHDLFDNILCSTLIIHLL